MEALLPQITPPTFAEFIIRVYLRCASPNVRVERSLPTGITTK
jgi:hypothetical protein